jgi:hypothetical protein
LCICLMAEPRMKTTRVSAGKSHKQHKGVKDSIVALNGNSR